jgi:hypothetical protein
MLLQLWLGYIRDYRRRLARVREPGSQETSWHVRPQIQGNAFAIVAQQMQ